MDYLEEAKNNFFNKEKNTLIQYPASKQYHRHQFLNLLAMIYNPYHLNQFELMLPRAGLQESQRV